MNLSCCIQRSFRQLQFASYGKEVFEHTDTKAEREEKKKKQTKRMKFCTKKGKDLIKQTGKLDIERA